MNSTYAGLEPAGAPERKLGGRLGNLAERCRPRRPAGGVVGVAILAALNVAVLYGVVRPRVEAMDAKLAMAQDAERDARGEIALLGVENQRLRSVHDYSAAYRIPADLSAAIYDIALAEGLEPDLAYRLVQTESSFRRYAVSEAGAVGYTQILPSTAGWLDPAVDESTLFDRDVNLRLGFRYLQMLLAQSDGDMRMALLAYNRGPGRVHGILARGGDPGNGYALQVMGGE
jgi:soluble lytic murein transglycosylase-like protein